MIGLGGGSRFYQPVPDDELEAELVRKAIESGIGVIETAATWAEIIQMPEGPTFTRSGKIENT